MYCQVRFSQCFSFLLVFFYQCVFVISAVFLMISSVQHFVQTKQRGTMKQAAKNSSTKHG